MQHQNKTVCYNDCQVLPKDKNRNFLHEVKQAGDARHRNGKCRLDNRQSLNIYTIHLDIKPRLKG